MKSYREINQKIKSIEKVYRQKIKGNDYFGFVITLDNNETIKILQEQTCLCCEEYDVIILTPFYEDDPNIDEKKQMKGAYVNGVGWGKKIEEDFHNQLELKKINIKPNENKEFYCHVDLITDKGLFQIVCYNFHNGNYIHNIYVEWKDFTDLEHL